MPAEEASGSECDTATKPFRSARVPVKGRGMFNFGVCVSSGLAAEPNTVEIRSALLILEGTHFFGMLRV